MKLYQSKVVQGVGKYQANMQDMELAGGLYEFQGFIHVQTGNSTQEQRNEYHMRELNRFSRLQCKVHFKV